MKPASPTVGFASRARALVGVLLASACTLKGSLDDLSDGAPTSAAPAGGGGFAGSVAGASGKAGTGGTGQAGTAGNAASGGGTGASGNAGAGAAGHAGTSATAGAGGASGAGAAGIGGAAVGGAAGAGAAAGAGGSAGAGGLAGSGAAAGTGNAGDAGFAGAGNAGAGGTDVAGSGGAAAGGTAGASGAAGALGCPVGLGMTFAGSCYFLIDDQTGSRRTMDMLCSTRLPGAHLASFPDLVTEQTVMSQAGLGPMNNQYWIGAICDAHDATCDQNPQVPGDKTWQTHWHWEGSPVPIPGAEQPWAAASPQDGSGCVRLIVGGVGITWNDATQPWQPAVQDCPNVYNAVCQR